MPSSCCAVNCSNRSKSKNNLKFYSIPVNPERRKRWLVAIKREKWKKVEIDNARLCSEHFISGRCFKVVYSFEKCIYPFLSLWFHVKFFMPVYMIIIFFDILILFI